MTDTTEPFRVLNRDSPSPRRVATVAVCVVFVLASTAMQLWRVSGEHVWLTVWNEDATVFYRDALDLPLNEAFDKPYNGYGHAVPRILAGVGIWLPPEWYSAWAALSSTLVVSVLALFLYFASAPLLRAPLRRGLLAASFLVLPVLPLEVLAAMCNLQWMVPVACLFAVLFPLEDWGGIAVRAVIVVLAPLTSPLSLVAAPIALYQGAVFLRRRDAWRRLVVPVLYLEACVGQLMVFQAAEHRPLGGAIQPPLGDVLDDVAELYTMGVVLYGALGTGLAPELWRSWSSWLGWVGTVTLGFGLLIKLRRAESTARWWIAGFALASVAVFVFTMVQRSERVAFALSSPPYDVRYWIVPQFFLLIALLVPPVVERGLLLGSPASPRIRLAATSADGPGKWAGLTGGLPCVALSVLTLAWLAAAVVPSYRQHVLRSEFPAWPDEVADARTACRANPTARQVLDVFPPDWRLQMSCDELDAGS